jgi:hypothetical protein
MTRVQRNSQAQALVGQVDVTYANGHLHTNREVITQPDDQVVEVGKQAS